MVSRKALIIGSPDEKIPGVKVDVENLQAYIKSPIGGLWWDFEITVLTSPSVTRVRQEVEALKNKDYAFVFFAGHGYQSKERGTTILHVNSTETLNSAELRVGSKKQTLILDCCRKLESERLIEKSTMEAFALERGEGREINPLKCRESFDKEISLCDSGLVVMNSCSIDETAGENKTEGGYYTSSLIKSANTWAKKALAQMYLSSDYKVASTLECHDAAAVKVRALSGGRQTPSFESPRSRKLFPFSVVA